MSDTQDSAKDSQDSTKKETLDSNHSTSQDKAETAPVSALVHALLEPAEELEQEEAKSNAGDQASRRRGVYLLPNLVTTVALFSGFYAILASMDGKFQAAAIAVFVAMVFDGLDGRRRCRSAPDWYRCLELEYMVDI